MKIEIGKVINLITYHTSEKEEDFRLLSEEIAHGLIEEGHGELGRHILAQLSPENTFSAGGGKIESQVKIDLNKTFYLIARYWGGNIEGFVNLCDDKKEALEIFNERYMQDVKKTKVDGSSYKLLEVNAKEMANDLKEKIENKDDYTFGLYYKEDILGEWDYENRMESNGGG